MTVQRRQCPLGLLFHRLSKTCEFPWIADCRVSHPVSPSVPTLSLYSTIKNNRVLPTADITSERNSVDSKSSTGSYVGASIEVLETTTDFRTLDTNHIDQSGFTVSPLVSVSDQAGTVNRKEVTTKGSDVTSIVSFANENMSQMKSTAIIALKSHPTEATIHLNDSVATVGLLLTAGTSSADSTLDIGTARASEYSVRPTTDQDEITYDTVLRTQFNLQSTTTTTKSSRATMLKENSSRAVTISTVPAESSAAAEFISKERETILTSQHLDVNIYSTTAVPEYSQEKTTENFPVSVKSGSVEITTSMRTRNASRDATTAAREKTTGVEEYPRSPAAAETFTTITTIDNATVAVDENSSFTGMTDSNGILATKSVEDNTTLVTRSHEVSGTQAMTPLNSTHGPGNRSR